MANNSPQVSQLMAFLDIANNSPQAKQAIQFKSETNQVVQLGALGRLGKETLKGAASGATGGAIIGAVGGTSIAPGIGTAAGAGLGAAAGGMIGGLAGLAGGVSDEITGAMGMGKNKDKNALITPQKESLANVEAKNV